jgi:ABC-type antimicrobial peptide transport system permease subunit
MVVLAEVLALAVITPLAAGYYISRRRAAIALVLIAITAVSFAPLGADQPAPWQRGYPGEGDWRVVIFPLWILLALAAIEAGSWLRRRPRSGKGHSTAEGNGAPA